MNFINRVLGRYRNHPEAVIISCFFNPLNSPYRIKAFNHFLKSIKHLNYRITECVIGDGKQQLANDPNIDVIHTENLLWHKEALLNRAVAMLPKKFKYVFWVDADVIFTNKNWLVDGVQALQNSGIIQPFEYCVHMDKDELKPSFDLSCAKANVYNIDTRDKRVWRSFCANHATHGNSISGHVNYDVHGHVGFAWAARREILEKVPLYDKALIGGADHIIAHAAAGQIPHRCIEKSFTEDIQEVNAWSERFRRAVRGVKSGGISYVKGDLYHIWHGDIQKRDYLKRIRDFTPQAKTITKKDKNGMYVTKTGKDSRYMRDYFERREVTDNSFNNSMMMAYATDSAPLGMLMGGNPAGAIMGELMRPDDRHTHSTPVSEPDCGHKCDTNHTHHHHHNETCPPDQSSVAQESSNFS